MTTTPSDVLAAIFDVEEVTEDGPGPSYNVAPTDPVPVVDEAKDGHRRLGFFRWGLVPSWSKDASGGAKMINARVETLLDKPAFRSALSRRRCLLPADGFCEWARRADGTKQAWYVTRADGQPMSFAGLWEVWRAAPDGDGHDAPLLRTCSVITVPANPMMAAIHDRMPAVLEPGSWARWLARHDTDAAPLVPLLVPAAEGVLVRRPVSSMVNSVRNNGPELVAPAPVTPPGPVALKLL